MMAEIGGTMGECIMIFDMCCFSSDGRNKGDYEGPYHDIWYFFVFKVMAEIEGTMRECIMIFDVCCISSDV